MNDNLDETYYYDFTLLLDGTVTIQVFLYSDGAKTYFYDNVGWTAPYFYSQITSSQINFDWGSGDIRPGKSDNVTILYYMLLKPTDSGSYTFTTTSDDDTKLYLDGTLLFDYWTPVVRTQTSAVLEQLMYRLSI
jgi:hypothetical protein